MPDEPQSQDEVRDVGLTVEQFEKAIEALSRLRDQGKVLLHYTRRSSLRLIGDEEDLQAAFAPELTGEKAEARSSAVQKEIQMAVFHALRFEDLDIAARLMERAFFDDGPMTRGKNEKPTEPQQEAFRVAQRAKLELAAKSLVSAAVRDRIARLSTSTGPCLEELDYELIQERSDARQQQKVASPFLRLRLRYSDVRQEQYLGSIFSVVGQEHFVPSSFEVECDLSDIDLLVKRLSDAKRRLLKSELTEGEGE